ncbi:MAG TPA: carboxypeptidase regulatory-like domain-containing protein [Candidatus Kapabacteria bacterium]|nr:carboxypeptidase regulatory-like domain-containing protein [Candidatus Kapabacteria bacterium]
MYYSDFFRRHKLALVAFLFFLIATAITLICSRPASAKPVKTEPPQGIDFSVLVYDGTNQQPLDLARVALYRGTALVRGHVTDLEGHAHFTDVIPGTYRLVVRSVGYNDYEDSTLVIDESHTFDSITLFESGKEVTVSGYREPAITTVDMSTGNQIFEAETYHAPPTARMTQLIQENLLGAARAPTGEVHIRGQHGEFTYYVDGAPVPLGVFGGLNEVIDPQVIERATFLDGGWPAEYGGQIAGVIDVQTRVPTGAFHLDASTYGGTYVPSALPKDTLLPGNNRLLNMNGQSLSMSDHEGKFGWFLSGSRQETDRRIDPPVQTIFHDHGFDYFLYGKADYLLSDKDYLTLNLNYGVTQNQLPFDSVEVGGQQDDNQNTTNAFQTLSYFRTISSEADHESNLTIAGFAREGGLKYNAGAIDVPTFQFLNDSTLYNLSENRSFTTLGVRTKYDNRLSHQFMYAAGFNLSTTSGTENFTSADAAGVAGPTVNTPFSGHDIGAFVESEIHPMEWTRFDLGVRYDEHTAFGIPDESQISPRIKWNFLIDENNYAYLYYGRLFMPNNIEGLRTIEGQADTGAVGTLAERDNFYEAVYTHSFDFGLRSKLDYFQKDATPGVDDFTVGNSAVKTPVNIATVHTKGVELGLSYSSPLTPFSGYVNTSIIHAYGVGAVTGGYLTPLDDGAATDLDHDQRLSVVASLNYQPSDWYANVVGIYGSGLTNGNPEGLPYATSLFDFNQAEHTTPSWIFNIGGGYTFHFSGGTTIAPSLNVGNIFDNEHLLKGAYFSAASWEEPRNVIMTVNVHL